VDSFAFVFCLSTPHPGYQDLNSLARVKNLAPLWSFLVYSKSTLEFLFAYSTHIPQTVFLQSLQSDVCVQRMCRKNSPLK
jgi:hypothetical protein